MVAIGVTLSILRQSWLGVRVIMDEACSNAGIRMIRVHLPSEADDYLIYPAEILRYSTNEMMIYNAYFVMLLFKNVSNNNYEQFFNRCITELKAIVGVRNATDITPVLTPERAQAVREVLGANIDLCRTLIECLIDVKQIDGRWERFADYILASISWTGMSACHWVYDSLMVTESPIFHNEKVKEEVIVLADVMRPIARIQYPSFFPYFGPPEDVSKLKRSRFPIILSVAMIVKRNPTAPYAINFALPVTNDQIPLVKELVEEHMMTIRMRQQAWPMEEITYRRPAHHDAVANANGRDPTVNGQEGEGSSHP